MYVQLFTALVTLPPEPHERKGSRMHFYLAADSVESAVAKVREHVPHAKLVGAEVEAFPYTHDGGVAFVMTTRL